MENLGLQSGLAIGEAAFSETDESLCSPKVTESTCKFSRSRGHLAAIMIESVSGFLHHNLIVLLAVVLVPMKLGILRLCGDEDAQKAAFLSIPEDMVYVSLGLVLGDFATSGGAFRKHFANSPLVSMDLFVTVMIGVGVAVTIHVLAKWTSDQVKSWRAASSARLRLSTSNPLQGELGLAPADSNIRTIQIRHIALLSILYLAQIAIAIRWLAWIAGVLANV